MYCRWLQAGIVAASLVFAGSAAAQEIVHALSGTVSKADAQVGTLQIKTNDGSDGTFTFSQKASDVSFDRDVRAETTPVASFNKPIGDEVVVFYYGNGITRTAVAVKDLGPGPFQTVEGTVTKFDRHQHTLSVKPATGKAETFHLDPKAVADTPNGAVPGDKFEPAKGDNVRVIATSAGGTETAMFVRD